MVLREILTGEINLYQDSKTGSYLLWKLGHRPYIVKEESSAELAFKVLDTRILALERRLTSEKEDSQKLREKLEKICNSKTYKFFHCFGLI